MAQWETDPYAINTTPIVLKEMGCTAIGCPIALRFRTIPPPLRAIWVELLNKGLFLPWIRGAMWPCWPSVPHYLNTVIGPGMVADQKKELCSLQSFQGIYIDAGIVFSLRSWELTFLLPKMHIPHFTGAKNSTYGNPVWLENWQSRPHLCGPYSIEVNKNTKTQTWQSI